MTEKRLSILVNNSNWFQLLNSVCKPLNLANTKFYQCHALILITTELITKTG